MNINTRNMNFVNYNGQEMDWVKFNGDLVYENFKTLTSEGVPPLTLLKCKNTNMLGYTVYGNSVQQSKNLLDIQTAPRNGIVRATITNSGNGVKVTATAANNSCDFWTTITSLTTGEEYTISFTTERSGTTGGGIRLYVGSSMKVNNLNLSAGNYSFTFTAGESVSIYFYGASNNNVVGDYAIFTNVQLEKGSSATSYVSPYPTPEYPVEIQSVGDKTKNLFDYDSQIWTTGLLLPSTGVLNTGNTNYKTTDYIELVEYGKNYTVSFNQTYVVQGTTSNRICYYDSNKEFISVNDTTGYPNVQRYSYSLNVPQNTKYIRYSVRNTDTDVQIEEGTTPTPYEPYGYKIPVNVKGINKLSNNIFTSLPRTAFEQTEARKLYAEYHLSKAQLKKNTDYTIVAKYTNINGGSAGLSLLKASEGYPNITTFTKQGYTCLQFNTLNNLDTLVQLATRNYGSSGSSVKYENFMLLEGKYSSKTIPKYEPYIAPTTTDIYLNAPLRKIEDADAVKLPSGYTQLEYIESTGTQWIDTGIIIDDTCGFYIDAQKTQSQGDLVAIGVCGTGDSRWIYNISNYNINLSWNQIYNAIVLSDNIGIARHQAYMNYKNDRKRIIDNIEYTTISTALSNDASVYSVCLFAAKWRSNTPSLNWIGKIYAAQITKGTDIIANFIPCKNSNNVIGMYDTVNDVFYTNAGTGTFEAGPEIYADYIDYENQKVVRKIGNKVLNGTENTWEKASSTATTVRIPVDDYKVGENLSYYKCNKFKAITADTMNDKESRFGKIAGQSISSGNYVIFKLLGYTDQGNNITLWKNWLVNNNVEIIYPLATPTEENITLPDILLNKGTNIVDVDTSVTPSNMWIKYKGKGGV